MKTNLLQHRRLQSGMTRSQTVGVLCAFGALGFIWVAVLFGGKWKAGSDRSATIMNIRNCQQAMRGHQCMNSACPGDPFTRKDLEEYMAFPADIKVWGGLIDFEPSEVVKGEPAQPVALNGDHLWLQVSAPETNGYVGKYGFKDIADTTGW
jgi:hypothetical protein